MNISWNLKPFEELSVNELYSILKLRAEVFVVEQNCSYQDLDGKDLKSVHLMGTNKDNELIVYSRIVPPTISFNEVSIGRVLSALKYRKTGAGKLLMQKSIEVIYQKFGEVPIRISAQAYLKTFYERLGFVKTSEEYLEDGIPHIEMLKL